MKHKLTVPLLNQISKDIKEPEITKDIRDKINNKYSNMPSTASVILIGKRSLILPLL